MIYNDRREAGRLLAERLTYLTDTNTVVLALPRGGVPVAEQIARHIRAPLDVLIVRKVGVPGHSEYAMGAVGEGGVTVRNNEIIDAVGVSDEDFARVEAAERAEIERRTKRYRGQREPIPLTGANVLVVDDGIATGSTALAAVRVARAQGARRVIVATPVTSPQALVILEREADEVVALQAPSRLAAVGLWYRNFDQVTDDDVMHILVSVASESQRKLAHTDGEIDGAVETVSTTSSEIAPRCPSPRDDEVVIPIDPSVGLKSTIGGHLRVPAGAIGAVVFAHGSGSSRFSHRNIFVADTLFETRIATLLVDLLTEEEAEQRSKIFDIALLAERLSAATDWLRSQPGFDQLPVGYFGASTGGGAALVAAAERDDISVVVSRGGRPDLAGAKLEEVRAPTLLIVGGADTDVLALNRLAAQHLRVEHRLTIVPGATHLFEERGALEVVARLASKWFADHFLAHESPHTPISSTVR